MFPTPQPRLDASRSRRERSGHPIRNAFVLAALTVSAGCTASGAKLTLETAKSPAVASGAPLELTPAQAAQGPALALGITNAKLVGSALDAPLSWSSPAAHLLGAVLAGQASISIEAERLTARAAPTGGAFWEAQRPSGQLVAAADDERSTALALTRRERGESRVLVYDRRGQVQLSIESREGVAAPAFARGRLYLPWGEHNLSLIDAGAERELGRWSLPARIDQALFDAQGTLFLASGLGFFTLAGGTPRAFALPIRALPGNPSEVSAFAPEPMAAPNADARAGVRAPAAPRLYADPNRVREHNGHYLYVYDRIVLGLSLARASVDWVHTHRSRVLAAAALPDSFLLCDRMGTISRLGDDGVFQDRIQLSTSSLTACSLRPGRVRVPSAAPPAPTSFMEQLSAALAEDDPALLELQRFLLQELAARPELEATELLLRIATRPTALVNLQRDASELLAFRRTGAESMLAALRGAPANNAPVSALADALSALGEARAAPLLARLLSDPTHSSEALAHITYALEKLAGPEQYDALRVFFVLRRAAADDPHAVRAVLAAARTLLRLAGADAQSVLQLAAQDPLTVPEVRNGLVELLAQPAPPLSGAPPPHGERP